MQVPSHSPRWVKGAAPISNPPRQETRIRTKRLQSLRRMLTFLYFSFEVWKYC
jgi:hypothetical protein